MRKAPEGRQNLAHGASRGQGPEHPPHPRHIARPERFFRGQAADFLRDESLRYPCFGTEARHFHGSEESACSSPQTQIPRPYAPRNDRAGYDSSYWHNFPSVASGRDYSQQALRIKDRTRGKEKVVGFAILLGAISESKTPKPID